jgi:hypothetical protein
MVAVGLAGDWMLVVATAIDLVMEAVELARARGFSRVGRGGKSQSGAKVDGLVGCAVPSRPTFGWTSTVGFGIALTLGLMFLARHDTEAGHRPMASALAGMVVLTALLKRVAPGWTRRRLGWALATAWAVPVAALAANLAGTTGPMAVALVNRCRFAAIPTDDVERLAVWCRDHTPAGARFIGPPGPKTFRLWSRRSLAFNRAASPYHAAGLADWAARFRDHVDFDGPAAELVRAYQADRHGLERRYQAMSDARRAALAVRQGAGYVVAAPPAGRAIAVDDGPLELLHVEGRYAVYRVRGPGAMSARPPAPRPGQPRPQPQPQARTAVAASAGTG